jgi:hypothetical protein
MVVGQIMAQAFSPQVGVTETRPLTQAGMGMDRLLNY